MNYGTITVRKDGSYVILKNGCPYHVTQNDALFPGVDAHAGKNPEAVTPEPEPTPQTFAQARNAKRAEIIAGADAVKAALAARFSALEAGTWPEQEAGARAIVGDAARVKDAIARLILSDAANTDAAVTLVKKLAETEGATPEEFAARIVDNADVSYQAGITTLLEQRAFEAAVRAAESPEELNAVAVRYSAAQHMAALRLLHDHTV